MLPAIVHEDTTAPPRLRCDLNVITASALPASSIGPRLSPLGTPRAACEALRARGYEGLQSALGHPITRRHAIAAGLARCASGMFSARAVAAAAQRFAREGYQAATMLVGDGFEDEDAACHAAEAVLEAQTKSGLPIFVETHRGTFTQDLALTLAVIARFPELRFNADFSHYATGHLLNAPCAAERIDAMTPIVSRVRFIHARLANEHAAQIHAGPESASWSLFRELWTRAATHFLEEAGPGDVLVFAPELLPFWTGYAHVEEDAQGRLVEVGDRMAIADALAEEMRRCFEEARSRLEGGASSGMTFPAFDAPEVSRRGDVAMVRATTMEQLDAALSSEALNGASLARLALGTGLEDDAAFDAWASRVLEAQRATETRLLVETARGSIARYLPQTARAAERHPDLRFSLDLAGWVLAHEWLPHRLGPARKRLRPVLERTELLIGAHATPERLTSFGAPPNTRHGVMNRFAETFTRQVFGDAIRARRGATLSMQVATHVGSDEAGRLSRYFEARGVRVRPT